MPVAAIGAVGSVVGGLFQANAAKKAARAQQDAANKAAGIQQQDAQTALDWQRGMYGDTRNLSMPWINTGSSAELALQRLMGLSPYNAGPGPNLPGYVAGPNGPNASNGANGGNSGGWQPGAGSNPSWNGYGAQSGSQGMYPGNFNANYPNNMARYPGTADYAPQSALARGGVFQMGPPGSVDYAAGGGPAGGPGGRFLNDDAGGQFSRNFAQPVMAMRQNPGGPISSGGGPGGGVQYMGPPVSGGNGDNGGGAQGMQGGGDNSYLQPFSNWNETFHAPTNVTEQNDPGFQFRLQQGVDALQRSAAARGGALTGGAAKDINDYAQNYASNEYGNAYNRALNEYQQRYNIFQNNQNNEFNRLNALASGGQTQVNQLGNFGQQAADNAGRVLLGSGQQIGNDYTGAGKAQAEGYLGAGNAYANMVGGLTKNAQAGYTYGNDHNWWGPKKS